MRSTQRLDKIIGNFGFGTRKEIRDMAKKGLIKVDGKVVKDSSMHVDPESSEIHINGEKLEYKKYVYLMLNKPQGVISATWDQRHKTVLDLVPEEYNCFELFPAGRLDIDTEGLVLLTNDGQLAHDILAPKKHVPKTYYAKIDGVVTEEDIDSFSKGVVLEDGYKALPAKLKIINSATISEIEITIVEGKFHQIKRMFEAVDKKVVYLKRIKMGGLELDERLKLGEMREMTEEDLVLLVNRNLNDDE